MSHELEKILADALDRTQRQPGLALIHALKLDEELRQMGCADPITYSLHGYASQRSNSDQGGAPWRTSEPGRFDCLYQAHRQFGDAPRRALIKAKKS